MNTGIIYKITNTVNGKIYIGQTKEFYGDGSLKVPYGINERLKSHFYSAAAKQKNSECPLLNNSIRKHGKNNFIIEEICRCEIDKRDDKETYYIKKYNSQNSKVGYNILAGGSGCYIKIKKNLTIKNPEKYVKPCQKNGKFVGYTCQKRYNGKLFKKTFSSKKFTYEENKIKAINYIKEFMLNKNDNNYTKYNKTDTALPTNIIFSKNKKTKEICGYEVFVSKDGIKYNKTFSNSKLTMDEKLKLAIDYKNSVINS